MATRLAAIAKAVERLGVRSAAPVLPDEFPPRGAFQRHFITLTDVPAATSPTGPFPWIQAGNVAGNEPLRFQTAPSQKGVVRYFALDANNPAGELFVRFRFVINGHGAANYQAPPVSIGDVDDPADVWLHLAGGDLFEVQLQNLDTSIPYRITTVAVVWAWRLPTKQELLRAGGG